MTRQQALEISKQQADEWYESYVSDNWLWLNIENFIKQIGLTQYQLAKKMGVSVSTITELKMRRINKPSFELMCKIADALEVSLDEFRERK